MKILPGAAANTLLLSAIRMVGKLRAADKKRWCSGRRQKQKKVVSLLLIHKSLEEFAAAIAAARPVMPGGGCAAAAAGLMAAGLVEMALNMAAAEVSIDDSLRMQMQQTHQRLLACVDADAAAYNELLAAINLPQNDEVEKARREVAIEQGLALATATPLEIAAACLQTAEIGIALLGGEPTLAGGDLQIAVLLAEASAKGAIQMADLNLNGITEKQKAASLQQQSIVLKARWENVNGATVR